MEKEYDFKKGDLVSAYILGKKISGVVTDVSRNGVLIRCVHPLVSNTATELWKLKSEVNKEE